MLTTARRKATPSFCQYKQVRQAAAKTFPRFRRRERGRASKTQKRARIWFDVTEIEMLALFCILQSLFS